MGRTTSEKSLVVSSESGHSATETGSHDSSIQAPAATKDVYSHESAKAAVLAFLRQNKAERESGAREFAYNPNIDADSNPTPPEHVPKAKNMRTFFKGDDKARVAKLFRESRKRKAESFTALYQYSNIMGERNCVWIDCACPWVGKSSGIMWVGVHGADSVCVVTRRKDLDTMRLGGFLNSVSVDVVRSLFRKSIICELEDLEDPSSELRQKFQKYIRKPFGVVSANPGTNNIEQASDYDENKAIEFIKEKMKRDTNFDVYETTKTAIQAFQHLFRKKVKADEIEVSLMDPDCVYVVTGQRRDSNVEELSVAQIEKYLDDTIGESGLN